MLNGVAKHVEAGHLERARGALHRELKELLSRGFMAEGPLHPFGMKKGAHFLDRLAELAPCLIDDPNRAGYVENLFQRVKDGMASRDDDPTPRFLANHALLLVLPQYPETLEEAIDEAKYSLS